MTPGHRMTPGALRRLTSGEIHLARSVFGEKLKACGVWLLALPFWTRAFVPGSRLIVWPAASALKDFSLAPLEVQGVLIHELTHVWQAQHGVNLILAKVRAGDSDQAYAYDLSADCIFEHLNIEQQAMILQHAFLAANGASAPFKTHVYSAALANWPGSIFSNPHQV